MATVEMVSVEEYLATSYRPDCDFIDGVVEKRNLGQRDHALIQSQIPIWFWARRKALGLHAVTEWRILVAVGRYRVPDVCVVRLPVPREQVLTSPPYITIEVLSPEDTLAKLQQRLDDYLNMGVPNIWVIDAALKRGWRATSDGLFEAKDGILRTSDLHVEMPLADLFVEDLDA